VKTPVTAAASVQSQTVASPVIAGAGQATQTLAQTAADKSASPALPADTPAPAKSMAKLTSASPARDTGSSLAAATPADTAAAKPPRKIETRIFVPDRPPDDPGPGLSESEMDDASTPVTRFRTASKQP
jgi:hypothetical protein